MSTSAKKSLHDAIEAHQNGSLKKADTLYRKILSRHPAQAEAMHMRGVLKFQQGNYDYSKQLLSNAQKLDSSNPWIRYHLGDLYRTIGEFATAEKCLIQAIELGANDGDVYFILANTQFEQERYSNALENYLKAINYSADDPDYRLNLANCYEKLDAPDKAVQQLKIAVRTSKNHAIHLQLIDLLIRTGDYLDVSNRISQLPASTIVDMKLMAQTVKLVLEADRVEDASRLLDSAVDIDYATESHGTLSLITGLMVNVGRYKDARKLLEFTTNRFQLDAIGFFQTGLCDQTNGDFENAIKCHRQALQSDPSFGRAAYSLAINGNSDVTDAELVSWQQQVDSNSQNTEEKIQFLFASARTLDARGETESAFIAYQKANEMHHKREPFDPDQWDAYIDSVIENFSPTFFNKIQSMESGGENLVFIVGMPRSGSTLLEYQLTQNFPAKALGEHPTVRRLFMDLPRVTGKNLSVTQCAQHLTTDHIDYLRRQYLNSITQHGDNVSLLDQSNAYDFTIDKMLGNFLRLGMLAVMFPDARILHCARDAEATCVSCYTNLFARGLKFTYDLYGLGRAWQSYRRLMDHWQSFLPMSVYNVQYEQLVTTPEEVFSEISEFLGQRTNPQKGRANAGAINTASFYQARQPISTQSLEGWKRFEPYLDPLKRGLGK